MTDYISSAARCYNIINVLKASFSKHNLYSIYDQCKRTKLLAKYLCVYPRHSMIIKPVPAYQALVAYLGGHAAMPPPPPAPRNVRNRYTVKNGISNLYIFLKSALKMQEMPFQRPKFQNISEGTCPWTPLQLYRHYDLPLTKILAMPLSSDKGHRQF